MRVSGFMHGVNNPELKKRLNEHVLKTMEEMMTVTTALIRGETVAASKKKGHAPWKQQDQPKSHVSERKLDFRGQSREGRGSSRFTPLTRTPKEILATEVGKFKPPPPMLKKQIEELVRAGKLSHLIKEIKQGRDQTKVAKKGSTGQRQNTDPPMYVDGVLMEVITRDAYHSTKAWMNFMIVRSLSPYNGIIRRPGIREIQAVPSTAYEMLKFSVDGGIVTIVSSLSLDTR
ncbi:hypothetical protein Tco_1089239 [Tanacetum coccineum]